MPIFVERGYEENVLAEVRRRMGARHAVAGAVGGALRAAEEDFLSFLPYWRFTNRETGEIVSFGRPAAEGGLELNLWPGQQDFAAAMAERKLIYALKAGKLGFTELACAFDGWRLRFGGRNARVHQFSRDSDAAKELLNVTRFGLLHLPPWMQLPLLPEERGGDTGHSLKLFGGPEDTRRLVAYAAGPKVSIDQSCLHAHVDEFAHMPFAEKTLNAILSTIAPDGSCHIVTRGAGEDVYAATYWRATAEGVTGFYPFFRPWSARPDRDASWYARQEGLFTRSELGYFAPTTLADALAGDAENEFIPIELWDRCREDLPPLLPGDKTVAVLGVDAAVHNDCFAVVLVTRHPQRPADVAVRACRLWRPGSAGQEIRLADPESFIKALALGGCAAGHAKDDARPECAACVGGQYIEPYNIYEVAYDPYQLESTAQRLRVLGIPWREFSQQKDRLIADSELRDLIVNRRIAHDGNTLLREHIGNAAAKIEAREDRKIRLVKKSQERKIDLAVATSMAVHRCLYLLI